MRGTTIVELAAATTMVAALRPDDHPGWAGFLRRSRAQLATLAEHGTQVGGPHHPATTTAEAHQRFAGAALQRWIRVRDRRCIGPMCTRPAVDADIDHTRDWAHLGLTVANNLGPPCPACHALKHRGGWGLTQPTPGRFTWRSPLGGRYVIDPRPVLDTPLDPAPRADGRPRRVHGIPPPPRPTDTGLRTRCPHVTDLDEIPTAPDDLDGRDAGTDTDDDTGAAPPPF